MEEKKDYSGVENNKKKKKKKHPVYIFYIWNFTLKDFHDYYDFM